MEECSRSAIINDLIRLAPHTEIAHHIPGRIRLRLLFSGVGLVQTIDIESFKRCVPGILNVQIKPWARSVVIEYDTALVPFDLWKTMEELRGKPELESEVKACLQELWA